MTNQVGDGSITIGFFGEEIKYYDGAWHTVCTAYDNVWYTIILDFDCATDTYDIYIDGILLIEGAEFFNAATTLNTMCIRSHNASIGYYAYIDAVNFSWENDYTLDEILNGVWFELGSLMESPTINKTIGQTSVCSIKIFDFEGSLYDTWIIRDFTLMRITDDDDIIIFSGFLINKEHISTQNGQHLLMSMEGFSKQLDWTPNDKNYILEEGLIAATSFNLPNASYPLHADQDNPVGLCWDGTSFYILDTVDVKVYIYDSDYNYDSNIALGALTSPCDITWDGTNFFITDTATGKVARYNDTFTHPPDYPITGLTTPLGITNNGTHIYIYTDGDIVVYDIATFTLQDTIAVDYFVYGLEYINNAFYAADSNNNKIIIYNDEFNEINTLSVTDVYGVCGDDLFIYNIIGGDDTLYIRFFNASPLNDNYALKVTDNDEAVFDWNPDKNKFILGNDLGILVNNTAAAVDTETFVCNTISQTYGTLVQGDKDSLDIESDGDVYIVYDSAPLNAYIDAEMTNVGIADTNSLKTFNISYRFGVNSNTCGTGNPVGVGMFIVKNDGTEEFLKEIKITTRNLSYTSGVVSLERDAGYTLTEYIEENGGNWDTINIRFYIKDITEGNTGKIYIDYLEIDVDYDGIETPPVLEQIIGSYGDGVDSWIACEYDFNASQIGVGANFKIGDNTNKILADLFSNTDLIYLNNSTFSKYMARSFVGDNNMLVLKRVCELEGAYWCEDHLNEEIKIAKPADFEDSELEFTQSNYDHDWKIEDECNHVKEVIVYGADETIIASAVDMDHNTSKIVRQIIDSTINTRSEALEIANTQLAILKDKRPSIKIVLNYALYTLEPMQTINLTMVRPTLAAADYVVRRMSVEHLGYDKDDNEIMRTTIYCGLGSSPVEEKLNNLLKSMEEKIHKLKTNKYNE